MPPLLGLPSCSFLFLTPCSPSSWASWRCGAAFVGASPSVVEIFSGAGNLAPPPTRRWPRPPRRGRGGRPRPSGAASLLRRSVGALVRLSLSLSLGDIGPSLATLTSSPPSPPSPCFGPTAQSLTHSSASSSVRRRPGFHITSITVFTAPFPSTCCMHSSTPRPSERPIDKLFTLGILCRRRRRSPLARSLDR